MISVMSPPIEIRRVLSSFFLGVGGGREGKQRGGQRLGANKPRSMDCAVDGRRSWFDIIISFGLRRNARRLGQAFDDVAPFGALLGAFLALAEELDDHFALERRKPRRR